MLEVRFGGFPGSSVLKNPSASVGDMRHRFDPWSRKIPHAEEQLSPCANYGARTPEPENFNY